jgi:hypothetical protein
LQLIDFSPCVNNGHDVTHGVRSLKCHDSILVYDGTNPLLANFRAARHTRLLFFNDTGSTTFLEIKQFYVKS